MAAAQSMLPGIVTAVATAAVSAAWGRSRLQERDALRRRLEASEEEVKRLGLENAELRETLRREQHVRQSMSPAQTSEAPTPRPADEAPCETLSDLKPAAARKALRGIRRPAARRRACREAKSGLLPATNL